MNLKREAPNPGRTARVGWQGNVWQRNGDKILCFIPLPNIPLPIAPCPAGAETRSRYEP